MIRSWWLVPTLVLAFACSSKHGHTMDSGGGPTVDAAFPCQTFGQSCSGNDQCCSHTCGAGATCESNPNSCAMAGASCQVGTDCCSFGCLGNVCQTTCVADNSACTNSGQCCSGNCGSNNTCTPLNPVCKSAGNPCSGAGECCSGFCNAQGTCGNASYCVQNGDACGHDADCCGGLCNMATGQTIGTCSQPQTGSTNCSAGVDGTLCSDCGGCCSRLCEVYAPTGVKICQPAQGCRIDGDLCHSDSDCCGAAGSGLPGDGNVICLREHPTDPVGVCRNPTGCDPEGDVCHYKNYATCGNSSARNDCCAAPGNSGVCQLDALGVPRCYGLGTMCQMAGQSCAFSGDCCNGLPCVPDSMGHLVCGASMCQMSGQMCTNSADCCDGTTCVFQPGQTYGTCGGMTTCAQTGQSCSDANPCCPMAGACQVTGTGNPCPAGQTTGCTCFNPIF